MKAALLAIGACARRDWRIASLDAIKFDPHEFPQKLSICLPRGRFAGKGDIDTWMEETITLCRERLAFLFALTGNEWEFLDNVLDRGEVVTDLLDIDPDIRIRIGSMPMLAWKCLHVRKNRGLSG